jgi:hypothetical protein
MTILEFWILTPLLFASGYLLGRCHNRQWLRDRALAKSQIMTLTLLTLTLLIVEELLL